MHSWSNFGRLVTPGKVHRCSMFSPFVDNSSQYNSVESQGLINWFVTFSKLTNVSDFVSHLFWKFFRLCHDVLLFEIFSPTSLRQTVFI